MAFNVRHLLFAIACLSSLQNAHGSFETPFIEALDPPTSGVVIADPGNSGNRGDISVQEGMPTPNEEGETEQLSLVKIKVSGPGDLTIFSVNPPNDAFKVILVGADWHLSLIEELDYERQTSYFVTLRHGGADAYIAVSVVDINDNSCVIINDPDSLLTNPYPEVTDPNDLPTKLLTWVEATDPDLIDRDQLTYDFETVFGGGTIDDPIFHMDPKEGQLFLIKELNYRTASLHRLKLFVYDSGKKHNDSRFITIEVKDLPNEPPEFVRLPQSLTVDENTPPGTVIETVIARDRDLALNWPIEYTIKEDHTNNSIQLFKMEPRTGELTVEGVLDAEMLMFIEHTLMFNLTVTAKEIKPPDAEGMEMETSELISITIRDLNDRLPEICTKFDSNPNPSEDECDSTQRYNVPIEETHQGELVLNLPFVVRDLDSTFAYSQYDIAIAENTDPRIKAAFKIQPGDSFGTTNYTIVVNDTQQLDYDDEVGFWWQDVGGTPESKPHEFDIIITGRENKEHKATATISITVIDVNDNDPIFSNLVNDEYSFNVCEENEDDTPLNVLTSPIDGIMVCRKWPETSERIRVIATDADISPKFKNITYSWSSTSRSPPVEVDPVEGTMVISLAQEARNFDYELLPTEYFSIEAIDSPGGRPTRATVKFIVLDRNDNRVDIRLPQFQMDVEEGIDDPDYAVLEGITVTGKDLDPDIEVYIKWDETTLYRSHSSGKYHEIMYQDDDPKEIIKHWFGLKIDKSNPRIAAVTLTLNDTIINRELTDVGVDRVDLVIAAKDNNVEDRWEYETEVLQTLIVRINDMNDNPPYWEDIDGDEVFQQILETEAFPDGGDDSSDIKREIYTFRARDRDLNSQFTFDIQAEGCLNNCPEYLELVNLTSFDVNTGKATLYRTKGKMIDREETKFYDGITTDILKYKVTVCDNDCTNSVSVIISITVEDINDNEPRWVTTHPAIDVSELSPSGTVIATYYATDADHNDKYGKVSYVLEDTPDNARFALGLDTGVLTVLGPFDWFEKRTYTITMDAIDNYRPGIDTGSSIPQRTNTIITILDDNTHNPEFMTDNTNPLAKPYETWPEVDKPLNETITVLDKDDPSLGNGRYSIEIISVTKNGKDLEKPFPFRVGTLLDGSIPGEKLVQIIATKDFTGDFGVYNVTFEATDEGIPARSSKKSYIIEILDENLNTPVFIYPKATNENYENGTIEIIPISLTPGGPVYDWQNQQLPYCQASDLDDPLSNNSQVWFTAVAHSDEDEDDGYDYFSVGDNGLIILRSQLDDSKSFLHLYIKAEDKGTIPKSSETRMTLLLHPGYNRPPFFNDTTPMNILLPENVIGAEEKLVSAIDLDSPDLPGIDISIYYFIVGGSREYFDLQVRLEEEKNVTYIVTVEPLDREFIKEHQVVIFASNYPTPPEVDVDPGQMPSNNSYLLINIEVENEFDTHPEFPQAADGGIISGGFSANNNQEQSIATITVIDLDDFDYVTFSLSTNFIASDPSLQTIPLPPFGLNKNTNNNRSVDLILNFPPQPAMKGHFTFNITATDLGLLSTTVQCKMYMIKESNVVQFRFLNHYEEIQAKSPQLAEALSYAFQFRCNIDRISSDSEFQSYNTSIVLTHFIDLSTNEPIPGNYIEEQQFNPDVLVRLGQSLAQVSLTLAKDGIGKAPTTDDNTNQLTIYILVGGVGFLGVVLIVISTSCYFNNRSLNRRVRALTATTFGSQMSGLNRTGAVLDLPNTNEFAVQGSNPMWTTNPTERNGRNTNNFDTESIGSGGSVLIGVEDDDDFKNYKGQTGNPSAPYDQSDPEDDDLYGDNEQPHQSNNRGYETDPAAPYDTAASDDDDDDEVGGTMAFGDGRDNNNQIDMPPPPGFGDTNMRHNPLLDM